MKRLRESGARHCARWKKGVASSVGACLAGTLAFTTAAGATTLGDLAAQMKPGEWRVLNVAGDASGYGQSLLQSCGSDCGDNIFNFSDKMTWDPNRRLVHFIGHGHLREQKFITYTEATNSWKLEPKPYWDCTPGCPWGGVGHGYEHSALDPLTGNMYARVYNSTSIYKYTAATQAWSQIASAPNNTTVAMALEYFPDINGLVFTGGGSIDIYSESTRSWSELAGGLAMGPYHNVASYNPVHKIVLFGGGNDSRDMYRLNTSRQIAKVANAPINVGIQASVLTVDPVSGKHLLFGSNSGFYEYDVPTDTWSQLNASAVPFFPGILYVVATPISTHGVIMFAKYDGNNSKVYLYKHAPGSPPPTDTIPPATPNNLSVR